MAKSSTTTTTTKAQPRKVSAIGSGRRTIATAFDTVTDVIGSVNGTVGIATTYVSNRSKRMTIVDKEKVMLATAKDLAELKKELDADADVKALFDQLSEEW